MNDRTILRNPAVPGTAAGAAPRSADRSEIGAEHTWDLTHLYPDDGAWRSAKRELEAGMPALARFRGRLGESAAVLLECLRTADALSKEYARLAAYAGMMSDQDTRKSAYLGMQGEIGQTGSAFAAAASFIEPELLSLGGQTIARRLEEETGLGVWRHYLHDVLRRKEHTGTEGEERIIAEAGLLSDGPGDIHGVFSNADFPYPTVTLDGGGAATLTPSAFAVHRASAVREDRKKVFEAFFGAIGGFGRTFAAQLNAQVRRDLFFARARRYPSCLEAALHGNNIPPAVYRNLIAAVRSALPTFHRYLGLRRRLLGLDRLTYHDLYAPLVPSVERTWSYGEARDAVLASLAPLGRPYLEVARRAFAERWIDVYPTEGKRSGAYSNGIAYDVHPYILLNYNGRYDDVSTVTHELGHTMHSWLSNRAQPYATCHYSIFVAEVASTLNEALLFDHMLRATPDPAARLSLLGHHLEHYKGTVFRQTQFAEFELLVHEAVERGEALTAEFLDGLYLRLAREYYGHAEGVCDVHESTGSEWAYIPHFYYNFYVFQYATSFCASAAIASRVLAGDRAATERYLELLSAGGSEYPIDLLRRAGVDMATAAPVTEAIGGMEAIMREMERLIPETAAAPRAGR